VSLPPYILPSSTVNPPKQLTLTQFIQSILVGLTKIDGTLVRPKWQVAPPKQPDIGTNWIAFGIVDDTPDANGYVGETSDQQFEYQRQTQLNVGVSVYGPDAQDIAGVIRDGFQVPQNLANLTAALMGFVETGRINHLPDLIHERWVERVEFTITLRRQIQRTYPVMTFVSVSGTVYSQTNGQSNQIQVPIAASDS
jgi:hypothetical protein